MKSFRRDLVVGIATFNRPKELRRLMDRLRDQSRRPDAVMVADNANDPELEGLLREFTGLVTVWIPLPDNPGCGAGLRLIEEQLLQERKGVNGTFVVLDDDALPEIGFLETIEKRILDHGLDLLAPLILDTSGLIWSPPEPMEPGNRKPIRECHRPEDALRKFGTDPHLLCWCAGTAFAVTFEALRQHGLHRADYWLLGEDTEFSMRVARGGTAAFFCDLCVQHLPPEKNATIDPKVERRAHMRKFGALLQNLCYMVFHEPFSFHLKTYLAGNFKRWFLTFGWTLDSIQLAWFCFWTGAILGEPAGGKRGQNMRKRLSE